MSNEFAITTNAQEIVDALGKITQRLRDEVAMGLELAIQVALADIAARAPTPEQEYDMIMRGGHGELETISLGQSPDNRVRFERFPGKWMKDAVYDPLNHRINYGELTAEFGNIEFLENCAIYSYKNKNGSQYVSNFGGELFRLLEFGGTYDVSAIHAQRLAPDTQKEHRVKSMTKTFQGFRMYSGFDPAVFSEALLQRLRQIKF